MKKIYYLLILSLLISCYKEDNYSLSQVDYNLVKISFDTDFLEADGVSNTYIRVEVPEKIKKEYLKVNIKISNGKFDNDKQEIDATISNVLVEGLDKKVAKAKIITSQKVEDAIVEIKIGDFVKTDTLRFVRAYPNLIKTDLPGFTISQNYQTVLLTTKLTRPQGKVSLLSTAKIKAIKLDGTPNGTVVGNFLNYNENVNENGILTNQFSLGPTSCNCPKVYFVSETRNTDNTFKRDTVSLIVN